MDIKRILIIVVVFSLIFFGILYWLNSKNTKEDLTSIVETTYQQALDGAPISCERTWEIEKKYDRTLLEESFTEAEWDELDRKINVIADACKFDLSDPKSSMPFRPITKELRHDEPAGPWAGPTD